MSDKGENMRESIGPVLIALLLIALELNAAVTFAGKASESGDLSLGCSLIADPLKTAAESDAMAQARNFCDTFSLRPNRVGEFTYSESCNTVGSGFSKHLLKTVLATADFNCV